MSEIITVRDGDIIAAEINVIKENAAKVLISSAIEIGKRLVEAKSMVEHGQWGKWLEEKVSYSQSTANNMMKLYQEYGTGEVSLFDNWTNSEAFGKLSYTQHLALLALPFEDRAEFAESHQVAGMSTRELDKAVREELEKVQQERDAALKEKAHLVEQLNEAADDLAAMETDLNDTRDNLARAKNSVSTKEQEAKSYASQLSKAEKDKQRAEKSEKAALDRLRKLETELATAKTAEKVAREELDKALENPTVPESAMEQLRREIEAEAAKKAADEIEKKLAEAQKQAEAATAQAQAAEAKLAEAQKHSKMNDPDIIAFQTLAQSLQESYNVLNGYRMKVAGKNPDAGERLKRFQTAMLSQWIDALQGV